MLIILMANLLRCQKINQLILGYILNVSIPSLRGFLMLLSWKTLYQEVFQPWGSMVRFAQERH